MKIDGHTRSPFEPLFVIPAKETVSQFVIPAKAYVAGREPESRNL
jgi:hypothetical protein